MVPKRKASIEREHGGSTLLQNPLGRAGSILSLGLLLHDVVIINGVFTYFPLTVLLLTWLLLLL
jgi:hypothetical protein